MICAALVFTVLPASAHDIDIPMVIDTDMALDDVRALAIILSSNRVNVPVIAVSDGAASPSAGALNVRLILESLKLKNIRVACGKTLGKPDPPWRAWSECIRISDAGPDIQPADCPDAAGTIADAAMSIASEKLVYLCLGPMTNLAGALKQQPEMKDKIYRVFYYGGDPKDSDPGWNSERDLESAEYVFKSGVDIYCLKPSDSLLMPFDRNMIQAVRAIDTEPARLIFRVHDTETIDRLISENHLKIWDELVPICIQSFEFFEFVPSPGRPNVMVLKTYDVDKVKESYLKLLGHPEDFHLDARRSVVLKGFPVSAEDFRDDVAPIVKKIIDRYGYEEWKACVLTNEFHRHLGIYSLVGAKMGIYAREVLEAPFDTLSVVSYCGNKPPLSCMNDGLQVSTGASLGRGTIRIAESDYLPKAEFIHKDQKLVLTLKPEWIQAIKADIKKAVEKYGGLSPAYFAHVRKLSLEYWLKMDRRDMFIEGGRP